MGQSAWRMEGLQAVPKVWETFQDGFNDAKKNMTDFENL